MARTLKIILTSLALTVATQVFAANAPENSQPINRIVAIVNNTPITQTQVQQLIQSSPPAPGTQQPTEQMAVEALINQTLQMDIAKKAGITVTDADAEKAIASIAASNHMTVEQMKSKVTQTMSWANYLNEIKKQMLLNKVQQQAVQGKVNVSDAQIAAFVKEHGDELGAQTKYQYSDMLIPTSDQVSNAQALAFAKQIEQAWKPGMQLASLTTKVPAANASMAQTMQWQTPDNIPDVFLSALNTMKSGTLSQPIPAGNGVHILQLAQKQMASSAELKQRANEVLMQQAFMKAVKNWVTSLRKSSYIKIFPSNN